MSELKFLKGEYTKYQEIDSYESDSFYVTNDNGVYSLFLGDKLIASGGTLSALNQEITDRKQAIIDLVGTATDGYKTLGDIQKSIETEIGKVASEVQSYKIEKITTNLAENVKEAYCLKDKNGNISGETINIYKDSALKEVALSGQQLVFTYILSGGSESVVAVNLSSFLAESEFTDGLIVSDGQVMVNIVEATEDKAEPTKSVDKNFLEFEKEGNFQALAVRSVDIDCTVLQKDIVVAGLDGQFGSGIYENGTVITAGTDMYTILQNILCKEIYPSGVTKVSASASALMKNLTLTLDKSGEVEVGTLVTLTAGKTNGSSASVTASSINNMTYGYSSDDDDSQDSTATTITAACTTAVSDNNYTISATINSGFTGDTTTYTKTVPATVSGEGSAELAETVLGCVCEGTNKITINATGASYSYSASAINKVYYCSNLGNTDSSKSHTGVSAISSATSKPTKSATSSITGVYKYFMGSSTAQTASDLDSTKVRALSVSGNVTKDGTTTIKNANTIWESDGNSIVVACPSKYKLATVTDSMGNDYMPLFSETGTVSVATGSINTTYNVYIYPITSGTVMKLKNITLKKV